MFEQEVWDIVQVLIVLAFGSGISFGIIICKFGQELTKRE